MADDNPAPAADVIAVEVVAEVAGAVEVAAAPANAAPVEQIIEAPVEQIIEAEVAGVNAVAAAQADTASAAPALALTGPSDAWKFLVLMSIVLVALGALCMRWGRVI